MIERRSVPENKHYVAVKAADLDRLEAEIERLRAEVAVLQDQRREAHVEHAARQRRLEMFDKAFEPAAAFDAEGARIGVATCKTCGAAVVIDPRDTINYLRKHYEWHKERKEIE